MKRKTFLTLHAIIASAVGCTALFAPRYLLEEVKHAASSPPAETMARTVGVLLLTLGLLAFSVRDHADSVTLRSVLVANLVLQLGLLPIDPIAYLGGTFHSLGSFVPNTALHVVLAAGFSFFLHRLTVVSSSSTPAGVSGS